MSFGLDRKPSAQTRFRADFTAIFSFPFVPFLGSQGAHEDALWRKVLARFFSQMHRFWYPAAFRVSLLVYDSLRSLP